MQECLLGDSLLGKNRFTHVMILTRFVFVGCFIYKKKCDKWVATTVWLRPAPSYCYQRACQDMGEPITYLIYNDNVYNIGYMDRIYMSTL